jgi:hypothetical protein
MIVIISHGLGSWQEGGLGHQEDRMRSIYGMTLVGFMTLAGSADAQTHGSHPHSTHAPSASPYAGLEQRLIKALSDQQIADLRAGRGMGLALPAELNGYPGPVHVLELADTLGLSDAQRDRAKTLFEEMKAETIPLGERIIAEEAVLDRLFADRTITSATLTAATARIATAQGDLRAAHLRYHLAMRDALTLDQIALYDEKRGYRRR